MIDYWKNNTIWKCNRCEIINECPTGNIVKEINSNKLK